MTAPIRLVPKPPPRSYAAEAVVAVVCLVAMALIALWAFLAQGEPPDDFTADAMAACYDHCLTGIEAVTRQGDEIRCECRKLPNLGVRRVAR